MYNAYYTSKKKKKKNYMDDVMLFQLFNNIILNILTIPL